MTIIRNIALWLASVLFAVSLFSILFGAPSFFLVFRITMIFALPVALLYLPVVISLRDAECRRVWTILGSGILIGPACLAIWGFILDARGMPPDWQGSDIGPSAGACLVFAVIVGFLATSFYVIALRFIRWESRLRNR